MEDLVPAEVIQYKHWITRRSKYKQSDESIKGDVGTISTNNNPLFIININMQIKYKREIELNNILSLFLFMKISYI